ncbi:hypothetical protein BH23ACT9_BH23ACT9_35590 [soil metagenome]
MIGDPGYEALQEAVVAGIATTAVSIETLLVNQVDNLPDSVPITDG